MSCGPSASHSARICALTASAETEPSPSAAADGEGSVSAEAVKAQIRALCDAEGPQDILSDDKLVELLRERGYDLARRTVAKYREAIGIGSSVQRRRQKKLQRAG